jgi:hypothetical protein
MEDIHRLIKEMKMHVQNRISNEVENGNDVIIPDQYRRFQQER